MSESLIEPAISVRVIWRTLLIMSEIIIFTLWISCHSRLYWTLFGQSPRNSHPYRTSSSIYCLSQSDGISEHLSRFSPFILVTFAMLHLSHLLCSISFSGIAKTLSTMPFICCIIPSLRYHILISSIVIPISHLTAYVFCIRWYSLTFFRESLGYALMTIPSFLGSLKTVPSRPLAISFHQ